MTKVKVMVSELKLCLGHSPLRNGDKFSKNILPLRGNGWLLCTVIMLLAARSRFIVETIITHCVMVASHHLDVLNALKTILPLVRVVPLLVRKFGCGVDNGSC